MRYCGNCGNEIPEGMAFCEKCGAAVEDQEYYDEYAVSLYDDLEKPSWEDYDEYDFPIENGSHADCPSGRGFS